MVQYAFAVALLVLGLTIGHFWGKCDAVDECRCAARGGELVGPGVCRKVVPLDPGR
jgi:hypothetical protein